MQPFGQPEIVRHGRALMCTPCQEDRDHDKCAEVDGLLFLIPINRGTATCACHAWDHPRRLAVDETLPIRKPLKWFRTASCQWCGHNRAVHLGDQGTGPCPMCTNCGSFAELTVGQQEARRRMLDDGVPSIGWPQG